MFEHPKIYVRIERIKGTGIEYSFVVG